MMKSNSPSQEDKCCKPSTVKCPRLSPIFVATLKGVNKGMEKVPVKWKEGEKFLKELKRIKN